MVSSTLLTVEIATEYDWLAAKGSLFGCWGT